MNIRAYKQSDCATLAELFYNTVHTINIRDYTKEEVEAWATGTVDLPCWNQSFLEHHTIVAEDCGLILGFGDMDNEGYLDRLYVHEHYQNNGIAKALVSCLERQGAENGITTFTVHSSITAKPFFERLGYHVQYENTVTRQGVQLTNFFMEKLIFPATPQKGIL